MDNYEYVARVALMVGAGRKSFKVLDYGCGAGQIVSLLQARGIDAYGCDSYYAGGDYSEHVPPELFNKTIFPMNEGMIPFPDESFDLVTSNQVLEHVEDLDVVVSEMKRVLKPGGQVLSLFPNSGIWREGHCGVPFLHWFPKRSRPRIYYAFFMRCIGFGQFTEGKTRLQWSKDFCEWLDNWTFYRSYEEIRESFESRLSRMQHMEQDWIGSRWRRLGKLPSPIQRFIAFRGGSMVFLCEKPFPAAADNRLSIDFAKAANATARPSALDTAA